MWGKERNLEGTFLQSYSQKQSLRIITADNMRLRLSTSQPNSVHPFNFHNKLAALICSLEAAHWRHSESEFQRATFLFLHLLYYSCKASCKEKEAKVKPNLMREEILERVSPLSFAMELAEDAPSAPSEVT